MKPQDAYKQAGYAGYDYFKASYNDLKSQFPKVDDSVLIEAASRMSIACAIEMLASVACGAVDGTLSSFLDSAASSLSTIADKD